MTGSRAVTRRLLLAGAVGLALAAIAAGSLMGVGGLFAYLLPPLLLLVALALRRYPGERVLLTLMARARRRRPRAPIASLLPSRRPRVVVPRGGLLIASSLAVRPPPAPLALSLS